MKRLKAVAASVMACTILFSFTGCSGFKVIDDEDVFFDALDSIAKIDEEETDHAKNTTYDGDKVEYLIYCKDGDNIYTYMRFKKADAAMDRFEDFYDDFEDMKEDGDFEGSSSMSMGKTRGSVVFNGSAEDGTSLGFYRQSYYDDDAELYGGVYVNENVYIEVFSVNGSKRDKEKIANFLKELKFPKP